MKILTSDTVVVIAGKDKGKTGKVLQALHDKKQVVVEGVHLITRHIKKQGSQAGQIVKYEKPIDVSNVKLISPTNGKPTKVAYSRLNDGKKVRVEKKTGTAIPNPKVTK